MQSTPEIRDLLTRLDQARAAAAKCNHSLNLLRNGSGQSAIVVDSCGMRVQLTDHTPSNSWYGAFLVRHRSLRNLLIAEAIDQKISADGVVEGIKHAIRMATKA